MNNTPLKTTQCPGCLLVMHEYGEDAASQAARVDAAEELAWCNHHMRVVVQLRLELGGPAALKMLIGFEQFARRFAVRRGWWERGWGLRDPGDQPGGSHGNG